MNKIIAELFGYLHNLVHLAFLYLLYLIATIKVPEEYKFIPELLLQDYWRAKIIIILIVIYILIMGVICTLISINAYLSEIKDALNR